MARRKSKAKQREELIQSLLGFVAASAFFGTFYFTKSLIISLMVAAIGVAVIISILVIKHKKKVDRLKRSGIHDMDKMDGHQFEHYLSHLFKSQGYSVQVTSASGDYGADLVLKKDNRKIVVQAKRYSKNIGIEAIQQVHSSMKYYQADEAWVISNRFYTKPAMNLAKANQVQLFTRQELIDMILKINPDAIPRPSQILEQVQYEEKKCNKCGHNMIIRKGPRGEFYGCSTFPKCRNVVSI
ncbi:restriction endonuclease [Chengkuizengella axinellae]|uniref:Restriction endonuclease n=1 Tax=Chengkuizengella axinellae TaxID=3064388 RepID=A0ABT9J3F7_9BACL|nr:restriction endonuclease [Chengkuizengella sp. 2205SS18-9]MDP5276144.1 restriction endonuclease [Chengkuizengella sp. 2205SS18-9]